MTRWAVWDRVISLLYPPRCVLCGAVVEYGQLWCGGCELAREAAVLHRRHGMEVVVSPMVYRGSVRDLVLHLKRRPDTRAAAFLAGEMAAVLAAAGQAPPDCVTFVPASDRAMARRGHNQAALLAGALGERLCLPVVTGGLRRGEESEAQHRLSHAGRWHNARQSYFLDEAEAQSIRGRRVLLVDDILTTGATLETCALLLHQAGAAGVCGATATHTALGGVTARPGMEARSCAFFGGDLAAELDGPAPESLLEHIVRELLGLVDRSGVGRVLVGLDTGLDIQVAERVLELCQSRPDLVLECCVASADHTDHWTPGQKRVFLERRRAVAGSARVAVEYPPHREYSPAAVRDRDAYLLDRGDYLLAVWDGVSRPVGRLLGRAGELGKPCVVVDPDR